MRTEPPVDGTRVYIRGLPSSVDTNLVRDLLAQYGRVVRCCIYEDALTLTDQVARSW